MRFRWPLRAAAACALLGAVGCDYWSNLVSQKTVTKADLSVFARDVWTNDAVGGTTCIDSLRDVKLSSNGLGTLWLAQASPGKYAIRCTSEWYYPAGVDVELTSAGKNAGIRLVRKGGSDWYLEKGRKVAIGKIADSIRFPSELDWLADPADYKEGFRYEWSFRHAKRLSQGHVEPHGPIDKDFYWPAFSAKAGPEAGLEEGKDTVTLIVYSELNGRQDEYEVGRASVPFLWLRNKKPTLELDTLKNRTKVGCDQDGTVPERIIPNIIWSDSDGACKSLRLWSKDTSSSLRKLDTIIGCTDRRPRIPLFKPLRRGVDSGDGREYFTNTLWAEITDDNGEKAVASVDFITFTNAPPKATVRITEPKAGYYVNDIIPFELTAHDTDGYIKELHIDWQSHDSSYVGNVTVNPDDNPRKSTSVLTTNNSFRFPNEITVSSIATDDCGRTGVPPPFTFQIEKDSLPEIRYSVPDARKVGDSLRVTFDLNIDDADVVLGKDRFTKIKVDWDDNQILSENTATGILYSAPGLVHMYPYPEAGTQYTIQIHVEDAHQGKKDASFKVP